MGGTEAEDYLGPDIVARRGGEEGLIHCLLDRSTPVFSPFFLEEEEEGNGLIVGDGKRDG